ncbi:General control non-repressible 3 [Balamuthia mandrillaris]
MMELEKPDGSEEQAEKLLRRLGFTPAMQAGTVSSLSGGWRARLEMARALLVRPSILFLDEPTNHLDLHAVFQLAALLRRAEGMTVVVVSHDASFLDMVATDILSIHGCALQCVAGNYAAFEEKAAEYRRFHENKYENQQKEEARQMASTRQQRTHARRTGNDKAMKQAASREKKKQERIGLYREDGKRFKLNSLKKMDAKSLRLPSRAGPIQQQRAVSISLPKRHLEAKRVSSSTAPLLELRSAALSYSRRKTDSSLLSDLDAQVFAGDRIALVGKNGAGKSTLLRALAGDAAPAVIVRGEVRRPSGSKVALVDQNQLALLEGHLQESCAEFLLQRHGGAALVSLMGGGESGASQEEAVRKHLGRFGLGGDLALLPISALSGGLRVRLVLADVFAEEVPPDVLLLDEPTNHLDGETIAALVEALKTFPGAVLAVSHNCAFLLEVFKDLWICENGTLTVQKETEGRPFVDNFRTYAERYTPKSAKQVLQDMLRIRAARSALVVQQASTATSLLIS